MNRVPGSRFPLLALVVGGVGTLIACLGILAHTAPELARRIWPLLSQSTVANALIAMGAILMALEMMLILQWIRRRRDSQNATHDTPVIRTRDRS